MPTNGFNMRQHWMLPIVLAPNVLSQAPPAKVVVVDIEHFQSLQAGPFQPLMHMSVGEPPQPIKCIFDTGSSDIIVPQAGSAVCNLPNQQCRKAPVVTGDFEPAKSSDVKEVNNSTFNATFSGGDGFDGPFVKTTIGIGGAKVVESQVALAVNGSLPGDFPQFPICGVGPVESEQTDNKYVNMVAKMKENGVIGSNAMGVVLSRNPFENGTLVLGGYDRSRIKEELQEVPIDPADNGKIVDFVVNMTSIRLQMNDRPPKQGQQGKNGKKDKKGKQDQQDQEGQQGQQVRRSHYGRALPRPSGGSHRQHGLSKREDNNEGNGGNGGNGDRGGRGGKGGKGDNQGDRGDGNNRGGENNKKGNGKNDQNGGNNNKNNDKNNDKNSNQNNGNQNNGNQNNGNQNNGNQNNGNQNNGNQNNGNQNNGNQNNGNQNNGNQNNGNQNNGNQNNGNQNNGNQNNGNQNNGNQNNGNQNNGNQNNGNQNNGNQNNGNQNNGNQNNGNQNNGNQNNGNQNNGNQKNDIIDLGLKPSEAFTLIDTGGVILQLPRDSVEALAKALGTRVRDGELDAVDCAVVSDNNKLLFGFNNDKTIVGVPLSHTQISNSVLTAEDRDSGKCRLGIAAVAPDENLNSMGFPWASAVYTVFDLDNNRLLFAEAVENSTQPDIRPFP
ncbi:aspartic-type endopeptidase (OpsB), putative [Metarhizium acridum CQMa 102]|uniref:Aspartic-type endopeptidase (OpsB), putative n=1 Tax=Metarhizium acridum (strain CQMa 102) TaxID=655827 RepID=E9E6M3_METAQ|nr:aspartic-type endopeptidase (OpsB), putative [Metarhizium acridum CQMa 102]EFY88469.1 aspartic-type endopeptidase (OpsB), putative [Metarhizium acridum CQMa 102]